MSVEVLQGLQRKAIFTIKKDDIQALLKDELKKYAKTAKAQGFRPGKVPANIVEQMYGGKAYEDALNNQINIKFADLVVANKLNLVGYPKFDLTSSEGEEFIFAAVFEVMPEVKIGDLANEEIEKPVCELSDEHVEKTIEMLKKQRASYTETAKAAANGDQVNINFVGTVDGEEFAGGKAENYPFVLGQGMMLPEFEAGIIGLTAGETKVVEVNFPENYHAENLKGKIANFTITVNSVATEQLPELDDEFIKSIGVADGSEATLRTEIKENLSRELARRIHAKLRDNVLNALSKASPLEVPHSLVHDEIHHMIHTTEERMKKQGYKAEQIKLTHEMFEHDAKRLVTLRLLVQEFIKEHKVTISDDEGKAKVIEMASMYEDPQEYITWYFQDESRVNNARAIAMENKVTEQILAKAKIKEVSIGYEELMRETI
ncbi:MAG: trigger factor [Burkholderiales bacterium]